MSIETPNYNQDAIKEGKDTGPMELKQKFASGNRELYFNTLIGLGVKPDDLKDAKIIHSTDWSITISLGGQQVEVSYGNNFCKINGKEVWDTGEANKWEEIAKNLDKLFKAGQGGLTQDS